MSEEKQLEEGEIDECSEDDYPVEIETVVDFNVEIDLIDSNWKILDELPTCDGREKTTPSESDWKIIDEISICGGRDGDSTPELDMCVTPINDHPNNEHVKKDMLGKSIENGNYIPPSSDVVTVSADSRLTEKEEVAGSVANNIQERENKSEEQKNSSNVSPTGNESVIVDMSKGDAKNRSVLSEIDDIGDLICRQELIQQQLNIENANMSKVKRTLSKEKPKSLNINIIELALPLVKVQDNSDITGAKFATKRSKHTRWKRNDMSKSSNLSSKKQDIEDGKNNHKASENEEVEEYGIGIPSKRPSSPAFEAFVSKWKDKANMYRSKNSERERNKDNDKDRYRDSNKDKHKDSDKGRDKNKYISRDKNKDNDRDKNKDQNRDKIKDHDKNGNGKGSNNNNVIHTIHNRPFVRRRQTPRRTIMRTRKRVQVKHNVKEVKSSPSYSAQDEKEVKILQKQQEEMAFDNYSNIPMEIDDDEVLTGSNEIVAPLPLIETIELRPPPPPGEAFQPVHDQTSLCMTRSNVAWMPGFVETLDLDIDTPSPSPKIETIRDAGSPKLDKEDSISDEKVDESAEDKEEEEDVWALRAQALKSLACKRAVRAKEFHRNKKVKLQEKTETIGIESKKVENTVLSKVDTATTTPPPTPPPPPTTSPPPPTTSPPPPTTPPPPLTNITPTTPTRTPSTSLLKTIAMKSKNKTIFERKPPPPPPKHAPVIIQLQPEDFYSDSDDVDGVSSNIQQIRSKIISRRRKKYIHDETLLRDLQTSIKRCRLRMKRNSSSIVRDQLTYKKLQNEMTKHRILYEEQKENVKQLQEALQLAIKQKTNTFKTHNKLHENIKGIKDQLKEKIQVRNVTDERILRAKSIVSVNRLQSNVKGSINNRLREQLLQLIESLRESYQGLLNAEKSNDNMSFDDFDLSKYSSKNLENDVENNASPEEVNKTVRVIEEIDLTSEKDEGVTGLTLRETGENGGVTSLGDRGKVGPEVGLTVELEKSEVMEKVGNLENIVLPSLDSSCRKTVCQNSVTDLQSTEFVISNLVDLKNSFANVITHSDPSCITYSLLEILQGLGDAESAKKLEIQAVSASNAQPPDVLPNISGANGFVEYKTPLSRFKSYRLSPKFASGSMFSVRSTTFSNDIQPHMTICHYDLLGTCNDSSCPHAHLDEKCVVSTHGLINDLLAYQLNDIDGCESLDNAERQRHLNLYTNQFMKKYGEKLSLDKSTPFLWNHLKEFCRSKNREITNKLVLDDRNWFYQNKYPLNSYAEECIVDHYSSRFNTFFNKKSRKVLDSFNENQEIRYFSKRYNSVELLKERLGENPSDVKLWIALVQRILSNDKNNDSLGKGFKKISVNVREYALSVLSQGLEENAGSEELWILYLKLFAMNYNTTELRELCYHAVMYAANYNVWWTCLTLETSMAGKQEICTEMIKFIRGGQENGKKKSHYLTETILYATQLLACCEKLEESKKYLRIAVGMETLSSNDNKNENNPMVGVCEDLIREDKSLLWLCLISLHMFRNLPKHIFSIEDSGPGRLVNKENFLLEWQNGAWSSSEEDARSLFKKALDINGDRSVSIDLILLYENIVAFELSLGNIESAVSTLRVLVTEFPSFVDGWKLLLLLYIQFFPTEDIIAIGEEAVGKCDAHPMITYFFSKFLLRNKLVNLAVEYLTKCIHSCFKFDHHDDNNETDHTPSSCITQKYKKLITECFSSSAETTVQLNSKSSLIYHCLCYCLLSDNGEVSSITSEKKCLEAFEYVIHLYNSPKNTKMLWIAFMEYKVNNLSNMTVISHEEYQSFVDLIFQCLASVSAIGVVKQNPNISWRDYTLHNKVIDMALAIIPADMHSILYQKLINFMPDNAALALRMCDTELEHNNYEQARVLYSSMLSEFPNYLQLWNTAIKIESKCGNVKEVRWLLTEATKSLPFCSCLWKELGKFEISYSTNFDTAKEKLKEIASKAATYGINVHNYFPKVS